MNSLFAKLSAALLLIVGLMGTAFFVVDRINTRLYYEELTQQLNAPIAMYVTGQRQLIENGEPDLASLRELAAHAMVINPTAEISYVVPPGRGGSHVTLAIYDCRGRRVRSLIDGATVPGPHKVVWDGKDSSGRSVASGVYFAVLRAGDAQKSHKLIVRR